MATAVSIIIITNDDSTSLRDTVPELLAQQYVGEFEVVVVRETRRGAVKDLLEPLLAQHQNLHSTFLPDRPQYVTDEEVEVLLGVKAAHYEHIIMVSPDFMPSGDDWLSQSVAALGGTNEGEPLPSEAPLLLGDAHYRERLGFLARRRHRKAVARLLGPWAKEKGLRRKALTLPGDTRHLMALAFRRSDYLDDMALRGIIHRHIAIKN